MRISIFGSCITRDVFRLYPDEADVSSYHSRSSLISLMASPLEVGDSGVAWPSKFARKVVIADFRKTFFDDLEGAGPDALIIDLMSERFDLCRAPGTYVTRSWELLSSGFDRRCGYRLERISRHDKAMLETWLNKSGEFARVLQARFPELPVILHKAYWASEYRSGFTTRSFPRDWLPHISRRNEMLEACYAQLERLWHGRLVAVEPRRRYVADPRHRWGLGSSHYEHAYYEDVRERLHAALRRPTTAVAS